MSERENTPTVGSIYSRFFKFLGQDFGLVLGLGIISMVVPGVVFSFLTIGPSRSVLGALMDTPVFEAAGPFGFAVFAPLMAPFVVALMAWNVSMLSYLAITRDSGLKPQFMPILVSSLGTLFPVLGLGLIIGAAVGIGLCLGVVPGILAGLALGFAVPAYICEADLTMIGALKRSIELTRNHRWTIFLVSLAALMVEQTLNGSPLFEDVPHDVIWPMLLQEAKRDFISGFGALLTPVIYLCLRDTASLTIQSK